MPGEGDERQIGRVLLATNKTYGDMTRQLDRECNGVVLDCGDNWAALAVPSNVATFKFTKSEVAKNIDNYYVYGIDDGTTVTLYWYKDEWRMSSANGFDIGHYQWTGESTYMQAFTSLAADYPEFSFDKLRKNECYTVGFRHPDFHPLLCDPARMWLIQTYELDLLNIIEPTCTGEPKPDIGIPDQMPALVPEHTSQWMKYMTEQNAGALKMFLESDESCRDIHYGYVLRCHNGKSCDIVMESSLLKQIRLLMYNIPKPRFSTVVLETPEQRRSYMVLKSYLNTPKHIVLSLFPQFAEQYAVYDTFIVELNSVIVNILQSRRNESSVGKGLEAVACALVRHISTHAGKVNAFDGNGPSIVKDFLKNVDHLDLYYSILHGKTD